MLIEDKELVDSTMGGMPWKAGKFSQSLRLSLWSEHLGLRAGEVSENGCLFLEFWIELEGGVNISFWVLHMCG